MEQLSGGLAGGVQKRGVQGGLRGCCYHLADGLGLEAHQKDATRILQFETTTSQLSSRVARQGGKKEWLLKASGKCTNSGFGARNCV